MYFKLSFPIQEGNLLVLLIKIRLFFTLIGNAKIAEFLCVLRELCKGSMLLLVSNPASIEVMLHKLSKHPIYKISLGLNMPRLTVVVQHYTVLNFQQEIRETFIFCVPPQLHWALLKLPVHTLPFLMSSGKILPVGSFFSSFVLAH